jgi:surface antigen
MRVLIAAFAIICAGEALAQSAAVPGIIAKRETELLSYEDKLAAYDAEQAVLSQDAWVEGYHWKGPKGAYGTIIAGGAIPQPNNSTEFCRRFIHIVHHKDDGGANPTFQGFVCNNGSGQWGAR